MQKLLKIILCCFTLSATQSKSFSQTTNQTQDPAGIYIRAGQLVQTNSDDKKIDCPSASSSEFSQYPPFPPEWYKMEDAAYSANQSARALAHQARSLTVADWPDAKVPTNAVGYLNGLRGLSNDLADAALQEHLQGNDAMAIETLLDQMHLADSLCDDHQDFIHWLVGIGIRSEALDRLNVIMASAVMTNDAVGKKHLQTTTARLLMMRLLDQSRVTGVIDAINKVDPGSTAKALETLHQLEKRFDAESGMSAMIIACHLFQFENGNWPDSKDDLAKFMKTIPIDPFGDGKQTLGYTLIKSGLPDSKDRPLVFSRCDATAGLFLQTNEPHYSQHQQKGNFSGQFRDVAAWVPDPKQLPTTQAIAPND